jgi:hypothetical protein
MRKPLLRIVLLVALAFFSFLMIRLTLPYTAIRSDVHFLRTKQSIYHIRYWRISFYTHVFTSCLVLLAGFTQFAPRLLARRRQVHRVMGWVYLIVVTTISGPAAFIMALYANGGLAARMSFTLLASCWISFTLCAGYYAVRRRFALHGAFMFRSYALTLSAITLRAYTYLIDLTALPISPREIYILTAWFSWVPNLLLAEVLIRRGWVERIYRSAQRPIDGREEHPSVGISH